MKEKKYKVLRGASWINAPYWVRKAIRNWGNPADAGNVAGFRLVRKPNDKSRALLGGLWANSSKWARGVTRSWGLTRGLDFTVVFRLVRKPQDKDKALRGDSWIGLPWWLRVAARSDAPPHYGSPFSGFRLVKTQNSNRGELNEN